MNIPPFIEDGQQEKDRSQLKIIAVFHFVVGGLAFVGIGFLFLHYFMMRQVFLNPAMFKGQANLPPREILDVFIWLYFFGGILLVVSSVLNVISGLFILKRKNRMFSIVIGGLNCMQFPFGTILGVFTLIILMRDSVRKLYHE